MKRILLIASHLGAGSASLCYCLSQSKLIQWIPEGLIYSHPTDIESLLAINHKYSNAIGIYLNELHYNYQISHKGIYKNCQFIYLIRDPKSSIKLTNLQDAPFILDYYVFRLRRIYEMAKETPNAIFLTRDDLNKKGMSLITDSLNLTESLKFEEMKADNKFIDMPTNLLRKAEKAYELCIYRIKNNAQVLKC